MKYNTVLSGPGFVVHVVDSGVGAMWAPPRGQAEASTKQTLTSNFGS